MERQSVVAEGRIVEFYISHREQFQGMGGGGGDPEYGHGGGC